VEWLGEILYNPRNLAAGSLAGLDDKNFKYGRSSDAMHSRVEIDRNWHWRLDRACDGGVGAGRRSKRALAGSRNEAVLRA
jgi:hypothetical protein